MCKEKRAKSQADERTTAVYDTHNNDEFLWAAVSICFKDFLFLFNTPLDKHWAMSNEISKQLM